MNVSINYSRHQWCFLASTDSDGGSGDGTIIASIVVAVIVLLVVVILTAVLWYKRRKFRKVMWFPGYVSVHIKYTLTFICPHVLWSNISSWLSVRSPQHGRDNANVYEMPEVYTNKSAVSPNTKFVTLFAIITVSLTSLQDHVEASISAGNNYYENNELPPSFSSSLN